MQRTARSLTLADRAEQLSIGRDDGRRARLTTFLSQAYEWLLACTTPPSPHTLERLSPAWLRRLCAEVRGAATPTDPALAAAAKALREIGAVSACTSNPHAHVEAPRATQPIPSVAEALPRLTADLARLQSLELDFETALQREKLTSLQKLAYGASHEINNPLANIATRAQALLQQETDPERRRALATINDQAFRAFEMIANMMLFAKPPEPDFAAVDVRGVVSQVLNDLSLTANQQGTTLRSRLPEEPAILEADATQLAVLLRALVRNALEAVECGGEVEVAVARRGDKLQLSVGDTGPGLSEEARRHLFDPFYSSREAGRGLGFGLSWCWTIVEMHGGAITFESDPARGTTFCLTMPILAPCPNLFASGAEEMTNYEAPNDEGRMKPE